MNIVELILIKYFQWQFKPFLNNYGYATPDLCEIIINNIDISFFIYKYRLIALSNYTKQIDYEQRSLLILSIMNQNISHAKRIKKLIYYLYSFPDANKELSIIFAYINCYSLNKQFFLLLNQYFSNEKANIFLSKFLLYKI